ncbi:MAG: hypothetical protein RIE23_05350 [Pontimonas sp.]
MVHHAGTVELVLDHLEKGDNVTLVHCAQDLQSCPANKWHQESLCGSCRAETNYSVRKLLPKTKFLVHRQLSDFTVDQSQNVPTISTRDELLDYLYKDCPVGRLVVSQLMSNFGDLLFELDSEEKAALCRRLVVSAVNLYEATASLINELDVSATYTWNGRRPSDGPVWWATKAAQREAFTYVTSGKFGRVYVSPESSVQEPQRAGFGTQISDELSSLGTSEVRDEALVALSNYKESRDRPMDSPDYSEMRSEIMPVIRPTVTILLSSAGESYHLDSFFQFFSRLPYTWVRDAVRLISEELPHYEIVVKWHPQMRNVGPMEEAHICKVIEESSIATHITPDENIDAYDLVEKSEFTVSMGSSVAIWGAANGVPAIILGPAGRTWGRSVYWIDDPNLEKSLRGILRTSPLPPLDPSDLYNAVVWSNRLSGFPMRFVSMSKQDGVPQVGRRPVSSRAVRPLRSSFDPIYRRLRASVRSLRHRGLF